MRLCACCCRALDMMNNVVAGAKLSGAAVQPGTEASLGYLRVTDQRDKDKDKPPAPAAARSLFACTLEHFAFRVQGSGCLS